MRNVGLRFWAELVAGVTSGVLFLVTVVWPQWIEAVFGADPDGGNGEAEWGIVALFAVVSLVLLLTARWEWRRALARA